MLDQSEAYKIEDKLLLTKQLNTNGSGFLSMRAKFYGFRMKNKAIQNKKRYQQLAPIHYHIIKDVSRKEFYYVIENWLSMGKSKQIQVRQIQKKNDQKMEIVKEIQNGIENNKINKTYSNNQSKQ